MVRKFILCKTVIFLFVATISPFDCRNLVAVHFSHVFLLASHKGPGIYRKLVNRSWRSGAFLGAGSHKPCHCISLSNGLNPMLVGGVRGGVGPPTARGAGRAYGAGHGRGRRRRGGPRTVPPTPPPPPGDICDQHSDRKERPGSPLSCGAGDHRHCVHLVAPQSNVGAPTMRHTNGWNHHFNAPHCTTARRSYFVRPISVHTVSVVIQLNSSCIFFPEKVPPTAGSSMKSNDGRPQRCRCLLNARPLYYFPSSSSTDEMDVSEQRDFDALAFLITPTLGIHLQMSKGPRPRIRDTTAPGGVDREPFLCAPGEGGGVPAGAVPGTGDGAGGGGPAAAGAAGGARRGGRQPGLCPAGGPPPPPRGGAAPRG